MAAHEDRLQTIREGGEVVLLTAAGCLERVTGRFIRLAHHRGRLHQS